jgi:hypothetical protein
MTVKGYKPTKEHIKKAGIASGKTRKLLGSQKGTKSHFWKEKIGYRGLHIWIDREYGKPHYCEHCKRSDLKHRQYNWANISGKYLRDPKDYKRLCVKCHKLYDKTKKCQIKNNANSSR